MSLLAIVGGSGFTQVPELEVTRREVVRTPFGEPSAPLTFGLFAGKEVVFLPRHGAGHRLPPHRINYRANTWALQSVGATHIIGLAAVGGITMGPLSICVPDQIIDYTYGRAHTYFGEGDKPVVHVDFTHPFCEALRRTLLEAADGNGIDVVPQGTYAAMQGPRFETIAEINRLERDGATIVGMTGMPEAVLARELELCYAMIAVVANPAAGRAAGEISVDEIMHNLETGTRRARELIQATVALLGESPAPA